MQTAGAQRAAAYPVGSPKHKFYSALAEFDGNASTLPHLVHVDFAAEVIRKGDPPNLKRGTEDVRKGDVVAFRVGEKDGHQSARTLALFRKDGWIEPTTAEMTDPPLDDPHNEGAEWHVPSDELFKRRAHEAQGKNLEGILGFNPPTLAAVIGKAVGEGAEARQAALVEAIQSTQGENTKAIVTALEGQAKAITKLAEAIAAQSAPKPAGGAKG